MPEDVSRSVMSHISFQDSLSFAKAINAGDTINPLKSNNLNPLSYCNPKDLTCLILPKIFKIENDDVRLFYLKKLIDRKFNGVLLLLNAARHGDVIAIKFLVDNGYKLDYPFCNYLLKLGRISVLKELINKGVERPEYLADVLKDSIYQTNVEAVKEILTLGFSQQDLISADLYTNKKINSHIAESERAKYLEIKKLIGDARKRRRIE